MNNLLELPMNAHPLRRLALVGAAGVAALALGGCVVAPPAYGPYGAYGAPAVVGPAAPVVVAPPVSVGIGVGGYWGGGPRYYGRPGYWGRGYWR